MESAINFKNTFFSSFNDILMKNSEFLGFFVLILIGWVLGRVLQTITARLVGMTDRFVQSRTGRGDLKPVYFVRSVPDVLGKFVFWIVFFFFIVAATETLGFSVFPDLLGRIAHHLPNVFAAAIIGFAGYIGGIFVRDGITRATYSAGIEYGDLFGKITQYTVFLVAILIAIDQVGIQIESLILFLTIVIAAILGAMGLAFALGARTVVSNLIASHYNSQTYQVGQVIKIENIQGRIQELTPSAIILESKEGRVVIPASDFCEKISILVSEEE